MQYSRIKVNYPTQLAWSPTEDVLAITFSQGYSDSICLVSPHGSVVNHIIESGSLPTWSPDGKRIAYLDTSSKLQGIHVINRDGSFDNLVLPVWGAESISWSRDGKYLAVVAKSNDKENQLCVVAMDTSEYAIIRRQEDCPAFGVGWWVDDLSLFFNLNTRPTILLQNVFTGYIRETNYHGVAISGNGDSAKIHVDGTVTMTRKGSSKKTHKVPVLFPRRMVWSHDGSTLVIKSLGGQLHGRDGVEKPSYDLYMVRAEQPGRPVLLPTYACVNEGIYWLSLSTDGRYVTYCCNADKHGVYLLDTQS